MKNIFKVSGVILLILTFFLIQSCKKDESTTSILVTDIDGNVYHSVTIGTQVWLVENLKTTKYRNGDSIPNITGNSNWSTLTTGAYCNYNNYAGNSTIYGRLYNWFTVSDIRNIAPTGWHVPTYVEWTTLENYLIANGYNLDGTTTGNKIGKALASDYGWTFSSFEGAIGNTDYPSYRNKSGFTALPGGERDSRGPFNKIGSSGDWWSSTEYSSTIAYHRNLSDEFRDVFGYNIASKQFGFSVRCVKDKKII